MSTYTLPTNLREQVDAYRQAKIARIDGVLRSLGAEDEYAWGDVANSDLPLRYALAHHVFEGVSRAVREGDCQAISSAMALRTDGASSLGPFQAEGSPIILMHPAWRELTDDASLSENVARSSAPVAIVSSRLCATATTADRDLVTRALGTAVDAGFGATVLRNTRVIALISELIPDDAKIRSWTTSALPATAHLDYFTENRYVSRELIHEAAHTELNDLFSALDVAGEIHRSDATFYAPWLETDRPVFGFLHGTWAFSHVALFCRWLLNAHLGPEISAVAAMMHSRYVKQLHASREDFSRAVEWVRVPELAELLTRRRDDVLVGVGAGWA
ncbi:HEXXH motif-containing putative peptide modification protein [Streptomyces sp. NPDC050448]|uniref:aKG-HExxH-type peptide beta-hydroxylase n=1 Tax=Streptomyces sp. NPDC050448 TaxID=3155404 RepID=UPI003442BB0A